MTEEELAAIKARHERYRASNAARDVYDPTHVDRAALLAEVERLRDENERLEADIGAVTLPDGNIASDGSLYRGNSVRYWYDKAKVRREENERLRAELVENEGVIAVWRRRTKEAEADAAALREALTSLSWILCDPDGNPCFRGSDGDIEVARKAFAVLARTGGAS